MGSAKSPLPPHEAAKKEQKILQALSRVIDPEVGLDIVTMGLIYNVHADKPGTVGVDMTLTTPGCPMSGYLQGAARQAVAEACPDDSVSIRLVWDPPWTPAMISRDGLDALRR